MNVEKCTNIQYRKTPNNLCATALHHEEVKCHPCNEHQRYCVPPRHKMTHKIWCANDRSMLLARPRSTSRVEPCWQLPFPVPEEACIPSLVIFPKSGVTGIVFMKLIGLPWSIKVTTNKMARETGGLGVVTPQGESCNRKWVRGKNAQALMKHQLSLITMHQHRSINFDKCTLVVSDVSQRRAGSKGIGTLDHLSNFSENLKLFEKSMTFFKDLNGV